jgi:hypothetical protein
LHKKFDVFLTKMIEDHVKCAHERKDKPNFLDILMENGNDHFGERLSLSNIKALLLVPISFPTTSISCLFSIVQVLLFASSQTMSFFFCHDFYFILLNLISISWF